MNNKILIDLNLEEPKLVSYSQVYDKVFVTFVNSYKIFNEDMSKGIKGKTSVAG